MLLAVVYAFQETGGLAVSITAAIHSQRCGIPSVRVLFIEAELGLDSGAVDAEPVQALARPLGQLHVLFAAVLVDGEGHLQVHAGDDLGIRQLPDVDVVAAHDSWKTLDVLADVLDANVLGGGLQENPGGCASKGDGRLEDDGGDEQRHGGIAVELARPVREPYDEGGDDDADVAQRVAQNMEHHGVHAHVGVAVAAGLGARLLRQGVVVAVVDARVAASVLARRAVGVSSVAVESAIAADLGDATGEEGGFFVGLGFQPAKRSVVVAVVAGVAPGHQAGTG